MPAIPSTLSAAFIAPASGDLPDGVGALTTTRLFPEVPDTPYPTLLSAAWPPTTHPKGSALETAFARHGSDLRHFLPAAPVWLQQVHGIDIAAPDEHILATMRHTPPTADAAITRVSGTVLAILTADCLPVILADTHGNTLAVVHAGWRGLAAGILEKTVARMGCAATQLYAWLGPTIGPQAFEVGRDVWQAFDAMHDAKTAACFTPAAAPEKWFADLYALARLRLHRLGVSRINGGHWCTYREESRFFSYRRQRDEGRMATFAWLSTPPPL